MKPFGTVYKITNIESGKAYVGITVKSLRSRWSSHCLEAKRQSRWLLHKAIGKYGREAFTVEALAQCADRQSLNEAEQFWIGELGTMSPAGYNMTLGGGGVSGFKRSEEFKRQVGDRARGVKMSPEARAKMSAAKKGKRPPNAVIAAVIASHQRAPISAERRAKMNAGLKGRKLSPEHIEKMRASKIGKSMPESVKEALRRSVIIDGQEFRSIGDAALAQGVTAATIARRIERGAPGYSGHIARKRAPRSPDQVEKMRDQASRPVMADGRQFPSMTAAASALGLTRPGVAFRIKSGKAGYALLA